MNDDDRTPWKTRSTYYSNSYAINPVQLKSDVGSGPNFTSNLRTAIMGPILTWAFDTPEYRRHIALYKEKQRPILRGANVYHILPMADGVHWDGLQFHNPDIKRGSVFLFKPNADVPPNKVIRLKGLNPRGVYTLTFQDRHDLNCVRSRCPTHDQRDLRDGHDRRERLGNHLDRGNAPNSDFLDEPSLPDRNLFVGLPPEGSDRHDKGKTILNGYRKEEDH